MVHVYLDMHEVLLVCSFPSTEAAHFSRDIQDGKWLLSHTLYVVIGLALFWTRINIGYPKGKGQWIR